MSPWTDFFVIIGVQFLFLIFLAYKKRAFKLISVRLVVESAIAGVIFGVPFDLLFGKYLGMFTYVLQFNTIFLFINGLLSYGLWFLTIQLLQTNRFLSLYAWTIVIGMVYELANYFYPVWRWTFSSNSLYQESLVLLVAYAGLGVLTAISASFVLRARFNAFKK